MRIKIYYSESGQVLIESILTNIILFMCAFSVIEITRLLAFKAVLHVLVSDLAQQISHSELYLKREGIIPKNSLNFPLNDNIFKKEIVNKIRLPLELFPTSKLFFDSLNSNSNVHSIKNQNFTIFVNFVFRNNRNPPGVYIKVNTCLPVLFSSFFKNINGSEKIDIGNSSQSSRNCLGHFSDSSVFSPLFWFRVRAAAYFPWSVSSQIYEKGFVIPKPIKGLENNVSLSVDSFINEQDLSKYFFYSTGSP